MNSANAPVAAPVVRLRKGRGEWRRARWLLEHRAQLLASIAATAIAAGGLLHLAGQDAAGQAVWGAEGLSEAMR